ncbi:MAG: hypothetical protein ABII27_07255 [bacterium]
MEIIVPAKMRNALAQMYMEIPPKALGILYCFIGVSLSFASQSIRIRMIGLLIGVLFFLAGFLVVILPEGAVVKVLEKFSKASIIFFRLWGIMVVGIGVLLVFAR